MSNSEDLVNDFQNIVVKIARSLMRRFRLKPELYDDLVSAGYLGLVEAAERYQDNMSADFECYAYLRVRGSMIDSLRGSSVLAAKSHRFIRAMNAIQHLREEDWEEQKVFKQGGKAPKDNLARVLELAGKGALAFRMCMYKVQEEVESIKSDISQADEKIAQNEDGESLLKLLKQLPEKEQKILYGHYFEDKSFKQIVEENQGMSKSWVSRLHVRALERMKVLLDES